MHTLDQGLRLIMKSLNSIAIYEISATEKSNMNIFYLWRMFRAKIMLSGGMHHAFIVDFQCEDMRICIKTKCTIISALIYLNTLHCKNKNCGVYL